MARGKQDETAVAVITTVKEEDIVRLENATNAAIAATKNDNPIRGLFGKATAIATLRDAIQAPGVLENIMALQGTRLGFRTDKDREGGYRTDVVGDAIIEALSHGIMPTGNEFNIIAGNFYATREGFEGLIKRRGPDIGLTDVRIVPGIPRTQAGGAVITMKVRYKMHGKEKAEDLDFAIKVNNGMGSDAIVGKAKRKALHWIWSTETGSALADADVDDGPGVVNPLSEGAISTTATAVDDAPVSPLEQVQDADDEIPMSYDDAPKTMVDKAREALADAGISEEVAVAFFTNHRTPPLLKEGNDLSHLPDAVLKRLTTAGSLDGFIVQLHDCGLLGDGE